MGKGGWFSGNDNLRQNDIKSNHVPRYSTAPSAPLHQFCRRDLKQPWWPYSMFQQRAGGQLLSRLGFVSSKHYLTGLLLSSYAFLSFWMCPLFPALLPIPPPFPCSLSLSCLPWELFSLLSSVPNSPECTLLGLTLAWSVTSNSLNCAITSGRLSTSVHSTSSVLCAMHYGNSDWEKALFRHLASVLEI